jgi:hypothetical protein
MRQYNIVSRILLLPAVITFTLAAPVLVQEKRQACVDVVHAPEDVITVLEKRTREQDLHMLWSGLTSYDNAWNPAAAHLEHEPAPPPNVPSPPNPAEAHVPPPNPAEVPEVYAPWPQYPAGVIPPNLAELLGPHVLWPPNPGEMPAHNLWPPNPADSDHESMDLGDDAPPASPESGDSYSEWSTDSGSEDFHTAPSSPGSSTESHSDSHRRSTIPNTPSAESQSENLKAADTEMRGKTKVLRRISGTASGIDAVSAAQMELRSAVIPVP